MKLSPNINIYLFFIFYIYVFIYLLLTLFQYFTSNILNFLTMWSVDPAKLEIILCDIRKRLFLLRMKQICRFY